MTTDKKTDKKTIGLTARGRIIVDDVLARGVFKDKLDVARFAMAFAMQGRSIPPFVDGTDTTWNIGSFDPDGEIKGLVSVLYPNVDMPYRVIESFVEAGLDQLGTRIQQAGGLDLTEILNPPQPVNSQFGEYDLLEEVTTGGMAEAFVARQRTTGQQVFLKRVKLHSADDVASIQRETGIYAKIMRAELSGILHVHEASRCDGYAFLVTEFADGGDLEKYVESFPGKQLRPTEARSIGVEIVKAIGGLHSIGVVHRDLKPGNILRVNGIWKIGDFGIAKNLTRLITQRTFQQAGTLGYAPQEQFDGVEAHSSADISAFGKVLVFLLSGQTDIDRIRLPRWRDLICRCTDRDRDRRPNAATALTELESIPV